MSQAPSLTPDAEFQALVRTKLAGDPGAMTALGARLLVGRDAPSSPVDGAALIEQAAEDGEPTAWAYLSVLSAAGVGRPQSWSDAYSALERAHRGGDASAALQLEILKEMGISGGADAERWTRAARRETIRESPRFIICPGLLHERACTYLIERARPRLSQAKVYDARRGVLKIDAMRSNTGAVFSLLETDFFIQLVRARAAYAAEVPIDALEPPEVLHYAVGECYRPHVDFFHPQLPNFAEQMRAKGQRVKTCLIYLNIDFEGGETEFPKLDLKYRGGAGDALIFENVKPNGSGDLQTLHAGLAPKRGEKWLFSQWIRSKAQPVA